VSSPEFGCEKKREPDGRQGGRSSMDNTGGDDGSSL
jgi:hypothetical protein